MAYSDVVIMVNAVDQNSARIHIEAIAMSLCDGDNALYDWYNDEYDILPLESNANIVLDMWNDVRDTDRVALRKLLDTINNIHDESDLLDSNDFRYTCRKLGDRDWYRTLYYEYDSISTKSELDETMRNCNYVATVSMHE